MALFLKFFGRYKQRINYNKELFFAELGGIALGPAFGQLTSYFSESNAAIAFCAVVGDYLGYTLMYASLSFYDNKKMYWNKNSRKVNRLFYKHMLKFIGAAVFVDVIYYGIRAYLTYLILSFGLVPYMAVVLSQMITMFFYIGLMNVTGSIAGIVKKKE